jgi:hypothetical protein
MNQTQEEREPNSRPAYVSAALFAGLYSSGENTIDSYILHKRAVYRADWLVAPLAYLVVAYWAAVVVIGLLGPTKIKWRPSSRMLVWSLLAGTLASVASLPYFWASGHFDPSIVVPLVNINMLYLVTWNWLGSRYLRRSRRLSRVFLFDASALNLPQILFAACLVLGGTVMTSVSQLDIPTFSVAAIVVLALIQQPLWAVQKIAADQGTRSDGADPATFTFWRVLWSALVTTLLVPLIAWPTGRVLALVSTWQQMLGGGVLLAAMTVGFVFLRVVLLNQSYTLTNRAFKESRGKIAEVALLSSGYIPLGVLMTLGVALAGFDWFGPTGADWHIWALRLCGACLTTAGVAFLTVKRSRTMARG